MNTDFDASRSNTGPSEASLNVQPLQPPRVSANDTPRTKRIAVFVVAGVFLLTFGVVAFGAGTIFGSQVVAETAGSDDPSVAVFGRAWDVVHESYVDEAAIDEDAMIEAAIEGMLGTLGDDGHTRFLTAAETELDRQSSRGIYYGVGIQVRETEDGIVVTRTFPNSSASEEGIAPDDVLIAVEGEDITELPLDQVIQRIRGPEGTRIELTFLRPSTNEEITFDLERRQIEISAVSWTMLENDIAILRLEQFSDRSGDDLTNALKAAQDQGAKGIILDLRGNPGGLVREARQIASLFVPDNAPIYISQTRDGGEEIQRAERGSVYLDEEIPLVVLIDQGSASASEIVSGSIKSQAVNGTLIGETSVGTGTVLRQFELGDGSTIWLGVELWLTPEGSMIREDGISPDIIVPLAEGQEPFAPIDGEPAPPVNEIEDDQLEFALDLLLGSADTPLFPTNPGVAAESPW